MKRIATFLILLISSLVYGQNPHYLAYNSVAQESYQDKKVLKFESKEEVEAHLIKMRSKQVKNGFVLASIDSIKWQNDTAFVSFYQGKKFEKIQISYDEEDNYILRKTPRVSERLIAKLPFKPEMVDLVLTGVNRYLNNTGYPFAKVFLKMEELTPEFTSAHLHIEKGPLVKITKIYIKGESKVSDKFVQSAIVLKEGDLYNAEALRAISSKIEQVQFMKEIKPYEVLFTPEGAELYLYLESLPVSSINGIVGIQPNPATGKTTVTGEVKLKLLNILKIGEELGINWRSLQPKTQDLKIEVDFPFLFNTPFGIEGKFNLYKLDSTFLQVNLHAGVRYYFSGGSYIKAFYESDKSSLLSGASSLPNSNMASVSTNRYGLGYVKRHVDYLPNPSKGFNVYADLSAGRRMSKGAGLDTTTVRSTTFKGSLALEVFIPLTPRHVFRLSNLTSSYYAPIIFQNELHRFGGLNTQRGFNEESLFATTLTSFSVEYRFLVDRDSHAFAFFDQSIYENNGTNYVKDYPFGFGLGYSFGTKLGIFSISYALGKQFDNPIQLRDGKVHFGFISYF